MNLRFRAGRELGARAVFNYLAYQFGLRTGWIRARTPASQWEDTRRFLGDPAGEAGRFFYTDPFALGKHIAANFGAARAVAEADMICEGAFPLFGDAPVKLGLPPNWLGYPSGKSEGVSGKEKHWTQVRVHESEDIRLLWELSRFCWLFPLVRAFAVTGQDKYPETFWELLLSWMRVNPPNCGPNWSSAQEVALRLLALTTAWFSFQNWLGDERQEELLKVIAAHARRIPPTMSYAAAQRNNHLVSEAAALYSAGLLFPQLRGASAWKRRGRRHLLAALDDQIFPDGGYAQYSTNYHRMVLALSVWVSKLAELNHDPFPAELYSKLARSTELLSQSVDAISGGSSLQGHNDGTLLFPFDAPPLSDLRPVLQAAGRIFRGEGLFQAGPWDEFSAWLGIPGASGSSSGFEPMSSYAHAGLHFLRGDTTWASLRCVRFRTRPAHSDQLHIDLWWRGIQVALDPGSYRYQAEPPWNNGLAGARVHNGPVVDALEPMRRLGPFLWTDWSNGRILEISDTAEGEQPEITAEHDGYRRIGIRVRRTLHLGGENAWIVVDQLLGSGAHRAHVAWTLPDLPYVLGESSLELESEHGPLRLEFQGADLSLVRAGERIAGAQAPDYVDLLGWCSPTYGRKAPALSALLSVQTELPCSMVTYWRFGGATEDQR